MLLSTRLLFPIPIIADERAETRFFVMLSGAKHLAVALAALRANG